MFGNKLKKKESLSLRHSLGGRILAGFISMACISLIVALAGIFYTSEAGSNFSDTIATDQQVSFAIVQLNVDVEQQSSGVLNYILAEENQPDFADQYLQTLQQAQYNYQKDDQTLHTIFNSLQAAPSNLDRVDRLYQDYTATINQVLTSAKALNSPTSSQDAHNDPVNLWQGPGQATKNALQSAINESLSFYESNTQKRIGQARQQVFFVTLLSLTLVLVAGLGGTIGAIVITRGITRPLRKLAYMADAIRSNNLGVEVPTVRGSDEVARLAGAMGEMTRNLRDSRRQLEESLHQTSRRNRELTAINRVTNVISRSLDLHTVLHTALQEMMKLAEVEYGSIFLFAGNEPTRTLRQVAVQQPEDSQAAPALLEKVADVAMLQQITQAGEVRVSGGRADSNEPPTMPFYIGIPLKSKNQVLGIANLASLTARTVTAEDEQLFTALGNQIGIAVENAQLYAQAQQLAVLEERNRLARDLHDSVTQTLFSLTLTAESARTMLTKRPEKVETQLEKVQNLARGALTEMRSLIFQLRPASLEEQGLTVAIQKHLDALQSRESVRFKLEVIGEGRLSNEHEQMLYRIAQEATNNVVKHANATEAQVKLMLEEGQASLSIEDNGTGFDLAAAVNRNKERKSLGLTSMRERAELAGGKFQVESSPGQGTVVRVIIPLNVVPRPTGLGVN